MQSRISFFVLAAFVVLTSACQKQPQRTEVDPARLKMFAPLPEAMPADDNPITEDKIVLGRMLYYETRLSKGHDISCTPATCWTSTRDNEATSEGHKGSAGIATPPPPIMPPDISCNSGTGARATWKSRPKDRC